MEGVAGSLRLNAPSLALENENACAPSGRASRRIVIDPPAATVPVPDRFEIEVAVAGSSVPTSRRAVLPPAVVGAKKTSIVQLSLTARTSPSQLFVSMPKWPGLVPARATLLTVSGDVPVF